MSTTLIVSASAGTGHVRAGEALRQAFNACEPDCDVEHVDILELAPQWVKRMYGGGFEFMAMRAPGLWRELYYITDSPTDDDRARWGRVAKRTLFREFNRLLQSRDWDSVLSTHFLPCQLAAGRPGLPPFALVVTDYTLHRYWIQPGVGRYFVATEAIADELRARVRGVRVDATGIPVDPRFADAPSRRDARVRLGLDPDRPVALLMGGGMGLGMEETAAAAIRADVPGLQVAAVCGRNEAARQELLSWGVAQDRLHVLGFVSEIETWLAAADVVATKPGGLTTTEALALGRPLLLTRAIPGHEEANVRMLVAAGAALDAGDFDRLTIGLERAFGEPGLLERLSGAARAMGRPHAAFTIANAVRSEPPTRPVRRSANQRLRRTATRRLRRLDRRLSRALRSSPLRDRL